ncbi:MAG: alpha/beta fold hydrolase [Bacteroidales bacterium]|jgi:pimeloyl-ACP methyl ester carboxylesterase|nr:alpha/beta fold hydrolase [Bacteroidales bacterium]
MELYYRRTGQGEPLVILHGLYGSSDNWLTMAKRLSAEYDVIIPDLRNHGRSQHHPLHNYPQMSGDILELTDRLHIGKYHIMGHSMGGKIAVHVAARTPERLSSLTVVDISPMNYPSLTENSPVVTEHLNLIHTLLETDLTRFSTRASIEQYWLQRIPAATCRFMLKNLQQKGKWFTWRLNLQVIARHLPYILNGMDEFTPDRHPLIRVPSLFIKGERSDYLPDACFSLIRKIFPNSKFAVLSGAGHWLHVEQPERFYEKISAFLKKNH